MEASSERHRSRKKSKLQELIPIKFNLKFIQPDFDLRREMFDLDLRYTGVISIRVMKDHLNQI